MSLLSMEHPVNRPHSATSSSPEQRRPPWAWQKAMASSYVASLLHSMPSSSLPCRVAHTGQFGVAWWSGALHPTISTSEQQVTACCSERVAHDPDASPASASLQSGVLHSKRPHGVHGAPQEGHSVHVVEGPSLSLYVPASHCTHCPRVAPPHPTRLKPTPHVRSSHEEQSPTKEGPSCTSSVASLYVPSGQASHVPTMGPHPWRKKPAPQSSRQSPLPPFSQRSVGANNVPLIAV